MRERSRTEQLADETAENNRRMRLVPASAEDAKPSEWLEEKAIPAGKLTLIAGKPDLGKSQLAIDKVARLTRGQLRGKYFGTPVNTVVVATEDDWPETIRPRLEAAEADLAVVC